MIMNKKRVVIVGAGPAGLFSAYELVNNPKASELEIYVIDKGKAIKNRICPVREGKQCAHCKPCNITHGFGGAGTFSDCKLSLSPHGVGGNIDKYVGDDVADNLATKVCYIFDKFDDKAKERVIIGDFRDDEYLLIENKLKLTGLNLLYNPTKHIGTDSTYKIMCLLYDYLCKKGVNFVFNTKVTGFGINSDNNSKKVYLSDNSTIDTHYLVLAPGRSGNKWLSEMLTKHKVETMSNGFDVGYRIETPAEILKELTDNLYDMKITMDCGDGEFVRTFCTNPNGFVSEEHYDDGSVLANGHSYSDKKSDVTNFAVLFHYTNGLDENLVRGEIARFGKKYGILLNNFWQAFYANDNKNISRDIETIPTLKTANFSIDVSHSDYVLFNKANKYICRFLECLNEIYPGVASSRTNVYGLEAKFYSDLIKVNSNFETTIPGVFCIGDGSGTTRGIIQSAGEGLYVADYIMSII